MHDKRNETASSIMRLISVDTKKTKHFMTAYARSRGGTVPGASLLTTGLAVGGVGILAAGAVSLFGTGEKTSSDSIKEQPPTIGDQLQEMTNMLFTAIKTFVNGMPTQEEMKRDQEAQEKKSPSATSGGKTDGSSGQSVGGSVSPLVGNTAIPGVKTAQASDRVKSAIADAARLNKIEYGLLYAIAGSESGFREKVAAGTSSAQGIGQFTAGTWRYLTTELYPELKYKPDDRNDPAKAANMMGLYVSNITKSQQKVLGRTPTGGEIYLGYFLGPTGGAKFLSAMMKDPKQIGADLFPGAAKSNRNIFYSGSTAMSLIEILAKLEGKIGSYRADADRDSGSNPVAKVTPSVTGATENVPPVVEARQSTPSTTSASSSVGTSAVAQAPTVSTPTSAEMSGPLQKAESLRAAEQQASSGDAVGNSGSPQSLVSASPLPVEKTLVRGRDKRIYAVPA